ncbi:MAG: acylphosphatase [Oscillospiraceae bacterium]|nr:acylphosphatase [Oscillospiraceae bacterium]
MEKVRRHFVFYGEVQGVGFRKRAFYGAKDNNVSGWVKNLSDGSVEMEAEGYPEDIDKAILFVEKGVFVRIENLRVKDIPLKNSKGFDIR